MRAELQLPFGLVDPQGKRVRHAVLTAINGHGELSGADDPNPFRAVLDLLAASTRELGSLHGDAISAARLGQLLPVDRDYLLLHLQRLTFGDVRYQTVECPQAGCSRRLDVRFALSSAEAPEVPDSAAGELELGGGRRLRFRLPTAADQAALHGLSPAALETAFLQRCVPEAGNGDGDDRDELGWRELMAMPAPVRAAAVTRILAASPEFDLSVPLACVECGRPFRFVFDPVLSLLAELRASRQAMLQEVHRLALTYHWSQAEILGLPRARRQEYLQLVHDEAAR